MASPSPLQLEHFVVHRLVVETSPEEGSSGGPAQEEKFACQIQTKFGKHKTEPRFRVRLCLKLTWPDQPGARFKKILVELEGFFRLPDGFPEDKVPSYIPHLPVANLMGLARGVVLQATAFCPGGPFTIPLMDIRTGLDSEKQRTRRSKEAGNAETPSKRSGGKTRRTH